MSLIPRLEKLFEGFVDHISVWKFTRDKARTLKTLPQIVLIAFKNAFDYTDHTVVIRELFLIGCRSSLSAFISNILSNTQHRVRYQDYVSE